MRDDYAPLFEFARATGLRFAEIVGLRWSSVKFNERRIIFTGKGSKEINRPLTEAMRAILWPLQGHHPEHVFTYVARSRGPARSNEERAHRAADFVPQAAKAGHVVGQRYPMTKAGAKTAWRRLKTRAGVDGFRFHDFRHDFATNLLRETGNLKLVQRTLGHADIKTTARYAHVLDDDARALLEAADAARHDEISFLSPVQSPVKAVDGTAKRLKKRGK
jgi:integrase